MALTAAQQWWVRVAGNVLNGAGYDATISGAGTNYADQDSPQLSLTDFATSGAGSSTLTSATGGFTSQMIGNVIRIASGTNFTAGYYAVTSYTNTNTVGLDRSPTPGGAGSGGTGRLGGAAADLIASFGSDPAPTITSPLVNGNTVWVRGSGVDDQSTPDYSYSGYKAMPNASASARITIRGYNGKPCFGMTASSWYDGSHYSWVDLKWKVASAIGDKLVYSGHFRNCIIDQGGADQQGPNGSFLGCLIKNTGSTAAGTNYAGRGSFIGCAVHDIRGYIEVEDYAVFYSNVIDSPKHTSYAVLFTGSDTSVKARPVASNTVYGATGDGMRFSSAAALSALAVLNNILVSNGGYGLNVVGGSADAVAAMADYNAFYNNTSGARNNLSAGTHDVTLTGDPFTSAAGDDFTLNSTAGAGAACKDVAYPTTYP